MHVWDVAQSLSPVVDGPEGPEVPDSEVPLVPLVVQFVLRAAGCMLLKIAIV